MIIWIQPDALHFENLSAATEVFLPIGQRGVHATDGLEQARAGVAAIGGKALVDRREVAMQQRVIAPGPRLGNAELLELGDECGCGVVGHATEGPAGKVHVSVNERHVSFS